MKRTLIPICGLAVILLVVGLAQAKDPQVATVTAGEHQLTWQVLESNNGAVLRIGGPDGVVFNQSFAAGEQPSFDGAKGYPDGSYRYELRVVPKLAPETLDALAQARENGTGEEVSKRLRAEGLLPQEYVGLSGTFAIRDGVIELAGKTSGTDRDEVAKDVLHYDDVIITGSLCVGFDCVNGESFGYDTIKIKENNLRFFFEDTSTGSFPTGDWRIRINDTTSGGASYFAVEDATNARTPFRIETGAPNHSIYVEDYGRVGFGTSIPYVELHIVDGDSPTIRLDQDGSSGWVAQSWDLCGNETNFFIRDVTNGSKLSFRIQPSTPSNTLCLRSSGKVGIGTWSPEYSLEVETTGENASVYTDRTDGAKCYMNATDSYGNFGTGSNHPTRVVVNSSWKARFNADGSLTMQNGASCTAAGVWDNASSRALKTNIRELSAADAFQALLGLAPVRFNYKKTMDEENLGFIAEDVPDLVASKGRETLSSMDVVAVLTKVVQEQQKQIDELRSALTELQGQSTD